MSKCFKSYSALQLLMANRMLVQGGASENPPVSLAVVILVGFTEMFTQ